MEITLSLNSEQLPVTIDERTESGHTVYDIHFENYTLSIYKNTLYTWHSDNPQGLSNDEIQSIGQQIENA